MNAAQGAPVHGGDWDYLPDHPDVLPRFMRYVAGVSSITWHLSNTQPHAWLDWVRACGGGVFHTADGLRIDAPNGALVYGRLVSMAGETVGITLGVQRGCRLSVKARHFHAPTLPALIPDITPPLALTALHSQLAVLGFAEASLGSFDASYIPTDGAAARMEYVLQLPAFGDLTPQLGATHRRHIRRGDREGWNVRILTGTKAASAICHVQQSTADRAASRERGFTPALEIHWIDLLVSTLPLPEHGLMVLGAYREDDTLLAAILLGWAAERCFYLIGGSTPEGYQCGAAVWLHSRAIRIVADHGIQTYNLGGTPADADQESSPAYGLYRFKTGFGALPVERRGVHWPLRPGHLRMHTILNRLPHR